VYRYLLFYKPYDVLCQFSDSEGRPTLKDFIAVPDVYAVGRLDRDSEGLLLLTNHGLLQHRVAHRQFAHPRTYWVQVERIPTEGELEPLRQGIQIQNYQTRPAQVHLLAQAPDLPARVPPIRDRKTIPTCWLEITLTEGRNRQVRHMTAAIGFPTLRLVRVAMGIKTEQGISQLSIGGLMPGEWREVTAQERRIIQQLLKEK
jgi:23S rRNA pseudouridine2457 synthase